MSNLEWPLVGPRKLDDGTYVWELPAPDGKLITFPYIDMVHDYGLFVRYAIESPEYRKGGPDKVIYTYGEFLDGHQAAEIIKRGRSCPCNLLWTMLSNRNIQCEA